MEGLLLVDPLTLLVADAMKNATQNGYRFDFWSANEIAVDLQTYCSDLEDYPIEEIEVVLNRVYL